MKTIKEWIIAHKLLSIIIAAVIVVGATLGVVLPIALSKDGGHTHDYSEQWTKNETEHWHVCLGDDCNEVSGKATHTFGAWTVKTPAGYGVNTVEQRPCSVCGYNEEKTVADTKLESHNTLVMFGTQFFRVQGKLGVQAYVLNGKLTVSDKVKVDGYNGELTVEKIAKHNVTGELNEIDYTYTDQVDVLFKEVVDTSEVTNGSYITKSSAPVQRYTKFTLNVTLTSERSTPILNNYRPNLELFGGKVVNVVVSEVSSSDGDMIQPSKSGTLTVTIVGEDVSAIVWEGMTVVGKEGTKTVFNGTVTGVVTA